jgi:uncharacterized protein (TIGR03437 family)
MRAACFWLSAMFGAALLASGASRTEYLNRLPLRFEENRARDRHADTRYIARAGGFILTLAPSSNYLSWTDPVKKATIEVRTQLVGADQNARLEPKDPLPGVASYFIGSGSEWRAGVPGFGRILHRGVYPGIDLMFHGEEHRLEYDFLLTPGANPALIRLELTGQRSLRVEDSGDLVISTDAGEIRWKKPDIYQEFNGTRKSVAGGFRVLDQRLVTFDVGSYDTARQLVIDPTLAYSTYLGAAQNEGGRGIGVDGAGNVYIVGNSNSTNLPTVSAVQANFGGQNANYVNGDAFIAKFSATGALVYLTYLGGSGDDAASAVAVDSSGNAYITGMTNSPNFPLANPYQAQFGGMGGQGYVRTGDAFVAKLNPAGTKLLYSTYLGGTRDDIGLAIAIDNSGNAYVAGATASMNFPTTPNAYQSFLRGVGGEPLHETGFSTWDPGDAFVAKLDPTGSQLLYSTYLGGTNDDAAFSIALDSSNNVYIGGWTVSYDFPTTSGASQRTFGGIETQNKGLNFGDGFVAKLNIAAAQLVYSTYFGGNGDDCINSIAVDGTGSVYMTGSTSSMHLQTTANAFQPLYSGYSIRPVLISQLLGDAFVAKLNPAGSALAYLTYLGGRENDSGTAIAVDSGGNAYVTGFTDSSNFPIIGAALQTKFGGDGNISQRLNYGDAFLAIVNPTGTALQYSSFFGGSSDDLAAGLCLDAADNVYITGETVSSNLTTTSNAAQKTYAGKGLNGGFAFERGDVFYAKFTGFSNSNPPQITKVANAEGEALTIAPNTWVEVKGAGLSATSRTWQTSDFVGNLLPTELDGVSVTFNGEKAFVYYISASQINVLTPPDLPSGTLQVVVNSTNGASASYPATSQPQSPSLFILGSGPYVLATHLNNVGSCISTAAYCLVGPTSLYPGQSTPAMGGETIVLYANGFGSVTPPVISGSLNQNGTLPTTPRVIIANNPATVTFAGLVSPGLYQLNIVVPSGTPAGDDYIYVTYSGATTPTQAYFLTAQ